MTKNTYNPYEIMMDKYDKEEMLSDVREAILYQLGVDVSCEELNHFFTGKGKAALSGCAEWQQCFAVEKMLEFYYVHARDETLAKQIETMTMPARQGDERHGLESIYPRPRCRVGKGLHPPQGGCSSYDRERVCAPGGYGS